MPIWCVDVNFDTLLKWKFGIGDISKFSGNLFALPK